MRKKELIERLRIVEVSQNSWEEENLLLLTTLDDTQIEFILKPLIERERASEDGSVIYSNEDMANILSDVYTDEIVVLYGEPDYLTI